MNTRRSLYLAVLVLFVLSSSFSSSVLAGQNPETRPLTILLHPEQSEPEPDWIVQSASGGSFGEAISSAGDVNGDGKDDIIVSAMATGNALGTVYAYYGSPSGLSSTANWVENNPYLPTLKYVYFGWAVSSAGDVNGDGYDDVLVSEQGEYGAQRGKVYLYYGSEAGLSSTAGWTREGAIDGELFGYALDGPCNVNGDAYDDLLITSYGYSNGQTWEGAVFVFLGSSSGPSMSPSLTFESNQEYSKLGTNISCTGDVNGDGIDDFIAGAQDATGTYLVSGVVWGWHGSSSPGGLSPVPTWMVSGSTPNFYLGYNTEGIGDVDGDGYSDVIVSAMGNYHAYVYRGSASGLGNTYARNYYQADLSSGFGTGMAGLGDINADGYDDFAIGALGMNEGAGAIFVYFGQDGSIPLTHTLHMDASEPNSMLGSWIDSGGDVDNDGDKDLIAGMRPNTALAYYGQADEAISGLSINSSSPDMIDETTFFTATIGTGSYVSYTWDFGDGHTGTGGQTSHVYAQEGDYTVTLTATNHINTQTTSAQVYIQRLCWVRLNNSPTDFKSVQAAVNASTNPADVVKVAGTCSHINTTGGYPQVVYLDKTLTIRGGYTATNWTDPDFELHPSVLDAQGVGRVIFATGNITPTIEGLHITGGNATNLGFGPPEGGSTGGGIATDSTGLILDHLKIYDNHVIGAGGAIANYQNNLTIQDSQIYSNIATYDAGHDFFGSGGLDSYLSTLFIENSEFTNNTGVEGGALRLEEVFTTIISTTFDSNQADHGGAVWTTHDGYFFQDCTFTGNQAGEDGGAFWAEENYVSIERSLFQGNAATDDGGALYLDGSEEYRGRDYDLSNIVIIDSQSGDLGSGFTISTAEANLDHLTLARNTSPTGAGLDIWNEIGRTSVVTMTNAIISDESIGVSVSSDDLLSVDGVLWSASTTITITHVSTATVNIQNQLVGDPVFSPDGYHITAVSDAIDTGSPSSVLFDIDRQPRPMRSGYDLGADEYPDDPITGLTMESSSPTRLGYPTWFTATVTSGTGITFAWIFGDGVQDGGSNPIHSYGTPGVYTAVVTATNGIGEQSQNLLVTVFEVVSLPPGGTVTTGDGIIQFNAPSQPQTLTITYTPTLTSSNDPPGFNLAGITFQLQATGPGGVPVITVSPPLEVTLHYDANALPPGMDENSLNLYRYDNASELWVLIPVISRNPAADTITVSLDHFSEYALMTPEELGIYVPLIMR